MIAFVDVSGDPYGQPSKSPWIAANVVCIRKRSIYDITTTIYKAKKEILGKEFLEIKSTDLINTSTLCHEELNKYKFVETIIYQCLDHCDCMHASVIFKNSGKNEKSDETRLPKHYRDILWRVECVSRKWNVTDVLVVIDNNARSIDRNLAFAFSNYIYRSKSGNILCHLLPVPIFADSATTVGVQLADIAAGISRKYHSEAVSPASAEQNIFHKKLLEYYKLIKKRSLNRSLGEFNVRGFFTSNEKYIL